MRTFVSSEKLSAPAISGTVCIGYLGVGEVIGMVDEAVGRMW